jgi:hypothetical protein
MAQLPWKLLEEGESSYADQPNAFCCVNRHLAITTVTLMVATTSYTLMVWLSVTKVLNELVTAIQRTQQQQNQQNKKSDIVWQSEVPLSACSRFVGSP